MPPFTYQLCGQYYVSQTNIYKLHLSYPLDYKVLEIFTFAFKSMSNDVKTLFSTLASLPIHSLCQGVKDPGGPWQRTGPDRGPYSAGQRGERGGS